MAEFSVPVARGPIVTEISVPPSKSIHQRALLLAALSPAGAVTEIDAPGEPADDVRRLAVALAAIAGQPPASSGPIPGSVGPDGAWGTSRDRVRCDLGMNATGFRLLAAATGLRGPGARTLLTGTPRLRARPHGALLRALSRLGAHARRKRTGAVRVLGAPWDRHDVAIPADQSSQPASALMLAAPLMGGLSLSLVGPARSRGYLALTESVLAAFGVTTRRTPRRDGGLDVSVPAGRPACARFVVEPDASSAAVVWAAAALSGGRATVVGLPSDSAQPDLAALSMLSRMGARVTQVRRARGVQTDVPAVDGPRSGLGGAGVVDLADAPDLAPLVGALAAAADGETRVANAPHLRGKESDRIATTVAAIRAIGGDAEPTDDGFIVRGRGRAALSGGRIEVAGDHRIALAFGALGLVVPGVVLVGAEAVAKSFPGFLDRLREWSHAAG